MGDCVVVMIGEPPDSPVRLHPIDFTRVTALEIRDAAGERWTPIAPGSLAGRYGGCLPQAG